MKFRFSLALALLAATAAFSRAQAEPTASGFWQYQDNEGHPLAWFLFSEKNNVFSARLVKGFKKPGDDTPPKLVCTDCPGKKKGAQIMGLTLFWGMKRDGLNYSDGNVLDPRDGSVYHAKMWIDEDGQTLHVRGYLGVSLLGQTQDWHRLPDDAMKKDEIPKEVLAGDDSKHIAEKAKHKKDKEKAKTEKSEPAPAEAETPAAADAPAPAKE